MMNKKEIIYILSVILCLILPVEQISGIDIIKSGNTRKVVSKNASNYRSLLEDTHYLRGFKLTKVTDGMPGVEATLDYNGTALNDPVWVIAQWNNYNNNLKDAIYSVDGTVHKYKTNNGTAIAVDTKKGSIILQLNTESEYGKSSVCPNNVRKDGDKWPHLFLGYEFPQDKLLKISGKNEIRMDINYTLTQMDNKIPAEKYDKSLHTSLFQWYLTIQNRTIGDDGFGEYLWLGLTFFDNRFDFADYFAAKDVNTTNAFIYKPDMKEIMGRQGKTEIGKKMHVDVDILPIIKAAFELAQKRGYMKKSTWKDLTIGSTNIGWEVFGTYNVSVTVNKADLKYR